jgi:hypothetical protein
MMPNAAPLEAREIDSSTPPRNCSQKREQRGFPIAMPRMMGLATAAEILGSKRELAESLGIGRRSVNLKLSAERGISDCDIIFAAKALEAHAARILEHARKLRDVVAATAQSKAQR